MSISNYPYESGEYWYLSTDVTVKRNQNIERIIIHFYKGETITTCHIQIVFQTAIASGTGFNSSFMHDGVAVYGDTHDELIEYKSRLEMLLKGRPKRRFFRNWRVIK